MGSLSFEQCFAYETSEYRPMNGLIQCSLHKTAAIVQSRPPQNKVCRCSTFFISTIRLCDTKATLRQCQPMETASKVYQSVGCAVGGGHYVLDCAAILTHVAACARGRSSVLTKVYWSRLRTQSLFFFILLLLIILCCSRETTLRLWI